MKVVWTATAVARLEEIEDYIAADDPGAAVSFVDALLAMGDWSPRSGLVGCSGRQTHAESVRSIIRRHPAAGRARG